MPRSSTMMSMLLWAVGTLLKSALLIRVNSEDVPTSNQTRHIINN